MAHKQGVFNFKLLDKDPNWCKLVYDIKNIQYIELLGIVMTIYKHNNKPL